MLRVPADPPPQPLFCFMAPNRPIAVMGASGFFCVQQLQRRRVRARRPRRVSTALRGEKR